MTKNPSYEKILRQAVKAVAEKPVVSAHYPHTVKVKDADGYWEIVGKITPHYVQGVPKGWELDYFKRTTPFKSWDIPVKNSPVFDTQEQAARELVRKREEDRQDCWKMWGIPESLTIRIVDRLLGEADIDPVELFKSTLPKFWIKVHPEFTHNGNLRSVFARSPQTGTVLMLGRIFKVGNVWSFEVIQNPYTGLRIRVNIKDLVFQTPEEAGEALYKEFVSRYPTAVTEVPEVEESEINPSEIVQSIPLLRAKATDPSLGVTDNYDIFQTQHGKDTYIGYIRFIREGSWSSRHVFDGETGWIVGRYKLPGVDQMIIVPGEKTLHSDKESAMRELYNAREKALSRRPLRRK